METHDFAATWLGANLSFWAVTLLVVISAAISAFSQNIVRAAFSLFFTLLGMAGFYVLLGSGFLAVTQVIIYIGGILVLLMFGVLLTDRPIGTPRVNFRLRYLLGSIVGALLLYNVFGRIILQTRWSISGDISEPREPIRELGRILLGEYMLALEIAGMTLLLCLIGAAYLVRRREP
jgi:NADH:ubiquinone oxidoreductase subunit 6 (subunit J)